MAPLIPRDWKSDPIRLDPFNAEITKIYIESKYKPGELFITRGPGTWVFNTKNGLTQEEISDLRSIRWGDYIKVYSEDNKPVLIVGFKQMRKYEEKNNSASSNNTSEKKENDTTKATKAPESHPSFPPPPYSPFPSSPPPYST
ncbi:hypothetical protein GGR51DRAFT_556944 [Nemania sp. FL0031]|nr:hypothetical protein GGR51DRAFT_556944 [Nemania sp. FL0031]